MPSWPSNKFYRETQHAKPRYQLYQPGFNSEGHLYCFVLPKFHEDGSHDPWGPRDVPWAQEAQVASA